MAKKTKRQTRRMTTEATRTSAAPLISSNGSRATEFNPDYSYIISDLKRIGVLAGSFFVVMVILALLQPLFLH